MAGNQRDQMKLLHTRDVVAATSSKGNQEKWYDPAADCWYKLDSGMFEALAETAASEIMARSNIVSELGFDIVPYRIEKVNAHRKQQIACVSPNFLREGEEIVTLAHLLKAELGEDYQRIFRSRSSIAARVRTLVERVEEFTGLTRFGAYLTLLFELDALILNEDRHLNNIAVLYGRDGYQYCPLFDNGAGFLLDPALYPFDVPARSLIRQTRAKPFRCSFPAQVRAARELYGAQLTVEMEREEFLEICAQAAAHYPSMYRPYLVERVSEVFFIQRDKLF